MLLTLLILAIVWWVMAIIYCCWVKFPLWLRILVWILSLALILILYKANWWFIRCAGLILTALACFWVNLWDGRKKAWCWLSAIWIAILVFEFYTEYNALQDYTLQVNQEAKNRQDILNKYTERDNNMSRIITLENNIIGYAKRMLNTDCATNQTCYDADLWNSLSNQLSDAFDEKDRVWNQSKTAISKQNQIKLGKKLRLLDFLWMDNSTELGDSLASYSSSIETKKSSINTKIEQIDKLEADCNYPPVITCTKLITNSLEKEK